MDKEPIAAIEVDGHKFHKYDRQKLKDSCKKILSILWELSLRHYQQMVVEKKIKFARF